MLVAQRRVWQKENTELENKLTDFSDILKGKCEGNTAKANGSGALYIFKTFLARRLVFGFNNEKPEGHMFEKRKNSLLIFTKTFYLLTERYSVRLAIYFVNKYGEITEFWRRQTAYSLGSYFEIWLAGGKELSRSFLEHEPITWTILSNDFKSIMNN